MVTPIGRALAMDRSWINSRLFSKEHVEGVNEFMSFVSRRFNDNEEMLCPCRRCLNRARKPKGQVEDHLYIHGMASTYTTWIHHGEPLEIVLQQNEANVDENTSLNEDLGMNVDEEDDRDEGIHVMVEELYAAEDEGTGKRSMFAVLLEEMKQELYPGAHYTRFSFVVKLLHIKSFYRISNVAFTALLKLLSSAFPDCSIPASYQEAKRLIRALGFGYNSIHVCPNNCVLFRKNLEGNDVCPVCGASRWKDNDARKKIPQKVLRHFPLIPRLKRMFSSKKMAEDVQWHKLKRRAEENELSHPADGEAWKDFDTKYGWFAEDARNIRLGLATDGFNPFGKMSSSHSMWPVFLIPYNFAPWECMEQSNFIMGLLIPGRECPGKDIDVFLEPLVEELLELWKGVPTVDAISGEKFDLHGVRYHTLDREMNRRTQNSGIMVEGTHANQDIEFYGCLKDIIELRYNSDLGGHRTVVLFRCDWFDTHGKKCRMKDDGIFRSINQGSLWYKDDPFILATQATKVFYLEDTKYRENWRVVQKFSHRHLWSVAENDKDDVPNVVVMSYQDDDCEAVQVQSAASLDNKDPVIERSANVDAILVDELRSNREGEVQWNDSSDEEDDTGLQYVTDDEGRRITPEDDLDDDSD